MYTHSQESQLGFCEQSKTQVKHRQPWLNSVGHKIKPKNMNVGKGLVEREAPVVVGRVIRKVEMSEIG